MSTAPNTAAQHPPAPAAAERALEYIGRGWRVLPVHTIENGACTCRLGAACGSPGKHPRTQHGVHDASADPDIVADWWQRWPDSNIGIATGAVSDLLILDIDPRNGGDTAMVALARKLGRLPPTPRAITGGDGVHLYFRHPGDGWSFKRQLAPGIDVQADGRFVVAPDSLHASGRRYRWAIPPDRVPVSSLPDGWLDAILQNQVPHTGPDPSRPLGTQDTDPCTQCVSELLHATQPSGHGQRHDCLLRLIRELARHPDFAGRPASAIRQVVREWHALALDRVRTKSWTATWIEASAAWAKVDPRRGMFQEVVEAALSGPVPACVNRLGYSDHEPTIRLVKACRGLQRHHGTKPFYLSCRRAAEVMGTDRTAAHQTLNMLCADGVLELVSKGNARTKRASEYRYVAD
jgi:hypothetical protein